MKILVLSRFECHYYIKMFPKGWKVNGFKASIDDGK